MSQTVPCEFHLVTDSPACCYRCQIEWENKMPFAIRMMLPSRMIVCPKCGYKRCPKALKHEYRCTASNEPHQVGVLEEEETAYA